MKFLQELLQQTKFKISPARHRRILILSKAKLRKNVDLTTSAEVAPNEIFDI
jgi:hypothetical protein